MLDESNDGPKLSGKVEMDESFYGGLEKNKHASKRQHLGTGGGGKEAGFWTIEREGKRDAEGGSPTPTGKKNTPGRQPTKPPNTAVYRSNDFFITPPPAGV